MAKKHVKAELKPSPTKRQLSRRQRQQRIQRIIVIVAILFFVLIAGYVGYGYYDEQFKPLHQSVLKINGIVFDMDYYIKVLELYSRGKDATETSKIAGEIIQVIAYGEMIRAASPDLGFGVSTDEVKSELKNQGLPDDKVYRDAIGAQLLAGRLLRNYFDQKVPTECEQVQAQALFVESDEVAKAVADKLGAGADFSSLAKEYSLEAVTGERGGNLGWLPKGFAYMFLEGLEGSLLEDIPFSLEPGMLSEPTYDGSVTKLIGYWLVEVTEKDEKKGSHVRGMLLGSRREADEIRARIEAGEDFGVLAKVYSQDSASKELGGDLGWTQEGLFTNRVALGLALPLEPGVLSQPAADSSAQTKGGYWLVKVVDKDESRVLDDETRGAIRARLFDDWVNEQGKKSAIESSLTEEQKSWAINKVLKDRGQ